MPLYIKVLTDYYHFLVGDLEEARKVFLMQLLEYLLLKDEYGYDPFFEGESERVVFLLKRIQEEEVPMSFETYIKLQTWHREDAWSDGELQEYFLHQRKGEEVKIMFDFDNASSEEIEILEYLNRFLEGKGRKFQVLNIHNARYVDVSELITEIKNKGCC